MSSPARLVRGPSIVALLIAGSLLLAACSSSKKSSSPTTTAPAATSSTSAGTSTTAPASTTAPSASTTTAAGTGTATLPTSCSAIPVAMISPFSGGVATTRSLATRPGQVSCEFANATSTKIIIVNIGHGTAAEFAILKAGSAAGGRTVTSISGLGSQAFSISQGGVVRGVNAFTAQGELVSVAANLTLAQNEALIRQLMTLK